MHQYIYIEGYRGAIWERLLSPKLMDITDWLPTTIDMTGCESNLQSLDGVSNFKQIWEGDLRKSAKQGIFTDWNTSLKGRTFNAPINAGYRKIFKSFKTFPRKIIYFKFRLHLWKAWFSFLLFNRILCNLKPPRNKISHEIHITWRSHGPISFLWFFHGGHSPSPLIGQGLPRIWAIVIKAYY